MPDEPTISVVIPAFNAAGTLRETMETVFAQTRQPSEVIIVDDGSTDETPAVIASFGDRVRSLRLQNTGMPAVARNRGVEAARSEWIAFIDADDLWEPGKLAAQLEAATHSPQAALIYTDRWNVGRFERTTERQSDSVHLVEGDIFATLLEGNFITTSSVMIKRDVLVKLGGFEEELELRGCEDWDLWLRVAAKHPVALCREPLMSYRMEEGTVSNNHHRMCRGRLAVLDRALATERGRSLAGKVTRQVRGLAWACSAWHIAPVDRWRGLAWYGRALCHQPRNVESMKGALKCLIGRTG